MALHAAKYGSVTLLVTALSDDGDGRDWATLSPALGDEHVLQDRGLRQRRTRCEILFCDEPSGASYLDRYLAFRDLARAPAPQLFTHPLHGDYLAAVADFEPRIDAAERCVQVACTFVAAGDPQPVAPLGAGVVAAAGPEAVGARAAAANAALVAASLSSNTPAAAVATATRWSEGEDPDARAIALEASSLAAEIDEQVESLELAGDLSRWPAYRALVLLRYSVVKAASSVTSETARVTSYTLTVAEPLRSLCARLYGAGLAEERAAAVAKLNRLRTPLLVPAGTVLRLPVSR